MAYTRSIAVIGILAGVVLHTPASVANVATARKSRTTTKSKSMDMSARAVEGILRSRMKGISRMEARLLAGHILWLCNTKNFPVSSVLAIIAAESGFRASAVSPVGAVGLMQLRPSTARYIAKKVGIHSYHRTEDLLNPMVNVTVGVNYLAYLRDRFTESSAYLAAYNMGPAKFKRMDVRPDSVNHYVESIQSSVRRMRSEGSRLAALYVVR